MGVRSDIFSGIIPLHVCIQCVTRILVAFAEKQMFSKSIPKICQSVQNLRHKVGLVGALFRAFGPLIISWGKSILVLE